MGPAVPLEEQYSALNTFHKRLLSQRLSLHPHSMQGLTMSLENDRSTPCLHEKGHFIILTMCDTLQLQNFLQRQAQEARRRMQHRDKFEKEEEDLVSICL
ncbi:T-cell activation inhibitor, mitochondrial-like [Carassius gibelio]|uniref:T-cell activation inhibitor, mitochondrial-like n=1 Tax=Carassius gibelio TaxID=101364 RepID=UPI0022786D60|nr:T-cell activation inhibitor, mitochondrial-like [Carassius gibelio]